MATLNDDSCCVSDDEFVYEITQVQRLLANLNVSGHAGPSSRCQEQGGRESPLPIQIIKLLSSYFTKSRAYPGDFSDEFFDILCDSYLKKINLSSSEIISLQIRTTGPSGRKKWVEERRKRLPAAAFGRVLHLRDKASRSATVTALLRDTQNESQKIAQEYIRDMEPVAIDQYQNSETGKLVKACGLFVHAKYGYLAASPVGLIGDDGILAVKCPPFARDLHPSEIPKKCDNFYCTSTPDGQLQLKTNSVVYYFIQGQLEITEKKFCDVVVGTQRGIKVERIYRDKSVWDQMFPKLETFYKLSLLPELVDQRIPRGYPIREPDFVVEAAEKKQNKK